MSQGMRIIEAARQLRKHPATLRRWIANGAPTASLGSVGRNKGSLVNIEDLQRWRGGGVPANDNDLLTRLAVALLDTIRRDEAHHQVHISEKQVAEIIILVYQRYHRNLLNEQVDVDKLPEEMKHVCSILL